MSNYGFPTRSEAGQADVYYCCPMCTFPRTQRPPEPGQLIVSLEAPDAEARWCFSCTNCPYPLNSLPEGFRGRVVAMPLPQGMNRGGYSRYPDAQATGEQEDTPPYPGFPVSMYLDGQRRSTFSEPPRNRANLLGQASSGAHQPVQPGGAPSWPAQQSMNSDLEEEDPYSYLFDSFSDTTSGSESSGSPYSTRNPIGPPPPAQQQQQRPSFAERFQFQPISPATVPPNRFQALANVSNDTFDSASDISHHSGWSGHSARNGVQPGQPQRPSLAERYQFRSIPASAVPPNRFQLGSRLTGPSNSASRTMVCPAAAVNPGYTGSFSGQMVPVTLNFLNRPSYSASQAMVCPTAAAATANPGHTGSYSGRMVPVTLNFLNRPSGMSTNGPMDQQGTDQQSDPANGTLPPMAPLAPLPEQPTNSRWRRIQDCFQRRGPLARLSRVFSPRSDRQSGNGTSRPN